MSLQSAHTHLVKTLYRQTLKLQLNWTVDLTVWRKQALATRNKFESARGLQEEGAINAKIKEAQKWIKEHWHPDPYNIPTQQGGSSFQRNVAPPVEVLEVPAPLRGAAHH